MNEVKRLYNELYAKGYRSEYIKQRIAAHVHRSPRSVDNWLYDDRDPTQQTLDLLKTFDITKEQ